MKVLVGMICSRTSDKTIPIYREFTEEKAMQIEEERDRAWFDILYDFVVEKFEKEQESNGKATQKVSI